MYDQDVLLLSVPAVKEVLAELEFLKTPRQRRHWQRHLQTMINLLQMRKDLQMRNNRTRKT